jgi:hypothetical protein
MITTCTRAGWILCGLLAGTGPACAAQGLSIDAAYLNTLARKALVHQSTVVPAARGPSQPTARPARAADRAPASLRQTRTDRGIAGDRGLRP